MLESARIGLKVDVDTLRGTREGVPRLAALFKKHRRRCHVLFFGGSRSHRARHAPGVSQGLRAEGRAHLGAQALRPEDPDVRRAAAGTGYRPRRRAPPCAACTTPDSKWGCTPTIMCAGRITSPAPIGGVDPHRVRARHERLRAGVRISPSRMRPPAGRSMPHGLELEQEYGLHYASDTRGGAPFLPLLAQRAQHLPAAADHAADLR